MRKYHVDVDGVCYTGDGLKLDYGLKDYVDQYRDLKLFYKEYVGEELLNSFISYTDKKNHIEVIDLRFQVGHINPQKIQLHQENRGATNNSRLFMILIRHRGIKKTSDRNKNTEVTII